MGDNPRGLFEGKRLENGCRGQANCSRAVEWKKLLHDEFVLKRVSVNMEKVVVNESNGIFQKHWGTD